MPWWEIKQGAVDGSIFCECFWRQGESSSHLEIRQTSLFQRYHHLPVEYFDQQKAWMSGDIMHKLLSKLNTRLRKESRSVILFIDNARCHPEDVASKYSNVKVVFLPPNTTSVL